MVKLTPDMMVGNAKIDNQHKELVDRLNTIVAMGADAVSKEETQKTLKLLNDYVVKHFTDEEALQKQSDFPKYEWHKGQHQLFIDELTKLKKELDTNGHSPQFALSLRNSIIAWIVRHIKSADVALGKHLKSKGM